MKRTVCLLAGLLLLAAPITAKKKSKISRTVSTDSIMVMSTVIDTMCWPRVIRRNLITPPKRIFEVPKDWTIDTVIDTTYILRMIEKPEADNTWHWDVTPGHLDTIRIEEWR